MIREHKFRVVILRHDEMRREIARVYIEDKNINLEMVKKGMAWWDGSEFEGVEKIKFAEQVARRKKIGLWKNPNAIHPSEFEAH